MSENRLMRNISEATREKERGRWRKFHCEELHDSYSSLHVWWRDKFLQNFGGKIWSKETTWKT